MLKTARFLNILFHPFALSFFNFLFLLLLSGIKGAVLGFMITFFFLTLVLIPSLYIAAVMYYEHKEVRWETIATIQVGPGLKLRVYHTIYLVVLLLVIISLNPIFLGSYKPLFASLIMGLVLTGICMVIFQLLGKPHSFHAIISAFYTCFGLILAWRVPGFETLPSFHNPFYLAMACMNLLIAAGMWQVRKYLGADTKKAYATGLLIGILSPLLLSLLTYGV